MKKILSFLSILIFLLPLFCATHMSAMNPGEKKLTPITPIKCMLSIKDGRIKCNLFSSQAYLKTLGELQDLEKKKLDFAREKMFLRLAHQDVIEILEEEEKYLQEKERAFQSALLKKESDFQERESDLLRQKNSLQERESAFQKYMREFVMENPCYLCNQEDLEKQYNQEKPNNPCNNSRCATYQKYFLNSI